MGTERFSHDASKVLKRIVRDREIAKKHLISLASFWVALKLGSGSA